MNVGMRVEVQCPFSPTWKAKLLWVVWYVDGGTDVKARQINGSSHSVFVRSPCTRE